MDYYIYDKRNWRWLSHGCNFTGALTYADDLTLVSPSISSLKIMIDVSEQYAKEFDILFNDSKNNCLCFNRKRCVSLYVDIFVNRQVVPLTNSAVHLNLNLHFGGVLTFLCLT